jgi:hypothetical protein
MTDFMKTPPWHNMAYIDGMTMRLHAPAEPPARLEYAIQTVRGLRFAGDASPVIQPPVDRARREGELTLNGSGGALLLTDRWKLRRPDRLHVAFQSYSPWEIDAQSATTRVGRTTLNVKLTCKDGAPITLAVDYQRLDGAESPMYALIASTDKATKFEISSEITWAVTQSIE